MGEVDGKIEVKRADDIVKKYKPEGISLTDEESINFSNFVIKK